MTQSRSLHNARVYYPLMETRDQIVLKHSLNPSPTKDIILVTFLSFGLIVMAKKVRVNFSPKLLSPCVYIWKTSKLRAYANRDEVQSFLNMDFNIILESVYYPLMEPEQNSSFSDTDFGKQECRQKSTLCRLPLYGKETYWPDYKKKKNQQKTPAQYHKSVSAKK